MICNLCNKEFSTIKELTKHLVEEHKYTLAQVYEHFKYSFETGSAICPVCGNEFIMTKRQIQGFKKNPNKSIGCCVACSKSLIMISHGSPLANPEIYKKTKDSLKRNYGVDHPAQSKEIQNRMEETCFKNHGVRHALQSEAIKNKVKGTNLERYKKEWAIASDEVKSKAIKTWINNYGVENPFQADEVKEKIKEKHLENFGVEHPMKSKEVQDKMKKTNLEKRGVEFPLQSSKSMNKMKKTNLENLGVEYTFQSPEVQRKIEEKMLSTYGVKHALQNSEIKNKMRKKNFKERGFEHVLQDPVVREKGYETTLKEYGVKYFCQHENCYKNNFNRISRVNKKFQEFLSKNGVESELEFIVENSGYDLKVNDVLLEIDPWFTHNSTVGPGFGDKKTKPKPIEYHLNKTRLAHDNGFTCIHIFDWDDYDKVATLLQDRKKVYARTCDIKEINFKEAENFLENYHLQGSTKQVKYAYGLFHKGELVEVMTFGKPRYNKNYEYELLRLCTAPTVSVVGGASKLLKYFEERVQPKSIISYCDLSKFNGEVYEKLGFTLQSQTVPARHWYNPKTKRHITDNLLRQRGFDQLHKANFGKGTSNEELMREFGYVEIYDCGQLVFVKTL